MVLLTLTLCSGLFYMHNLFSSENIDKAVLSIIAWFVYIVLLWGTIMKGGADVVSSGSVQRRWRRSADAGLFW